ncbi:hypothetical protein B565_2521 [Aeromonas veronii B565]|nr:hypothetical protein B565_2521 [Aeromonas veronii B565]
MATCERQPPAVAGREPPPSVAVPFVRLPARFQPEQVAQAQQQGESEAQNPGEVPHSRSLEVSRVDGCRA